MHNLKEWLYAVAFADATRGYAVGAKGIVLRTDDGGATWKDQESGLTTNLFAVSAASRDEALVAGDQGRVLTTKDGGKTWSVQPTITTSPMFAVTYQRGGNVWIAGHGGAILRRTTAMATLFPTAKTSPGLRGAPKLKAQENSQQFVDDGDIPRAKPPVRKPVKP